MVRRVFSIAMVPLLLAVAPPSPAPSPGPPEDHVLALAGTSTCRTMFGSIVHRAGRREGDGIAVAVTERSPAGNASAYVDRYSFDRTSERWRVRFGVGSTATGEGTAPPWTAATWTIETHDADGAERVHYQLLDGGDIRRTTEQPLPDRPQFWRPIDVERCTPGDAPPPADACVAENFPAYPVSFGVLPARRYRGPGGDVLVLVSLDAQSRVTRTRIVQSPDPKYNDYALQTVRLSTFQTEIRDCRPVANDYIFSVTFDL